MLTMYFYLSNQGGVERDMSVAVHHLCRMQFLIPFASDACSRSTAVDNKLLMLADQTILLEHGLGTNPSQDITLTDDEKS